MRVANDVLATFPGHAVKRGLPHQCAVGLGPRVLHSGYQHGGTRWPVSSGLSGFPNAILGPFGVFRE